MPNSDAAWRRTDSISSDGVKKLASETKLRQDSEQRFTQDRQQIEQKLRQMEQDSLKFEQEREQMRKKLDKSLNLLDSLKQSHHALASD